jgi:AcrR family transcriptional regulator
MDRKLPLDKRKTGTSGRNTRAVRRTQEDRRRETKRRLINSTIDYLSERGFENFSLTEIASNEGFSRGAIQHHYPSREALIADVVNEIAHRMHPEIDISAFLAHGIRKRVSNIVDHYWQIISSKTYIAMIEIIVFSRHDESLYAEVSRTLSELSQRRDIQWIEMFRDTPASARRLHDLRTFMLSTLRGLALRSMLILDREDRLQAIAILKDAIYSSLTQSK